MSLSGTFGAMTCSLASASARLATTPVVPRGAGSSAGKVIEMPVLLPWLMTSVEDLRAGWDLGNVVSRPQFYTDHDAFSQCLICIGVPRYPAMLAPQLRCPHVFCMGCLQKQLQLGAEVSGIPLQQARGQCSLCKAEFGMKDLRDYESWFPQMKSQWQEYRLRCVGRGCPFVGSPDAVLKHEFDCEFRECCCPSKGCKEKGTKEELLKHLHSSCKYVRVYCHVCGVSYYPKGEGEYGEHRCLDELKSVAAMMKSALMKRGVFWPEEHCVGFEPACSGQADFDSAQGTAVMVLRKRVKRMNAMPIGDAHALATSSPVSGSTSSRSSRQRMNDSTHGTGGDTTTDDVMSDIEAVLSINRVLAPAVSRASSLVFSDYENSQLPYPPSAQTPPRYASP